MKIVSLNVCGLRSKIICPDFISYINCFDIIGFQETKADCIDDIDLHDYILYFKHLKESSKRKSGGIALAYRKRLDHYINPLESESKLVIWFTISKQLTKSKDLLCGIVYTPPESSDYSVSDPYQEIENELYRYTDRYEHILLFGDYNSRTNNLPDFIHIDPYISFHFDADELDLDYQKELSFFDQCNSHVSIQRTCKDRNTNNYGYKMLDFCKCNNLFILNGRTASDKNIGSYTCKDSSTVDYFICSANILPLIIDFYVDDFCLTL